MIDVLSLVSIQFLPSDAYLSLIDAGITKVAIAPSHCGILNFDGSISYEPQALGRMLTKSDINFHSMQGILFGIDPNSTSLNIILKNRLNSIQSICDELGIKNVVIGSPAFRVQSYVWQSVLKYALNSLIENSVTVSIENICSSDGTEAHDPFGPSGSFSSNFSRVLDISNAIDCEFHSLDLFISKSEYSMFHTSGRQHTSFRGVEDARLVADIIGLNPRVKDCVWEFNGGTLQTIIDSYTKSKNLLAGIVL
jgi:hypothetical protein